MAQTRKARAQDKDLSRRQPDIDTDKREKAFDALTIVSGCEYCQHSLNLGDIDFNKLSSGQLVQDMWDMAPKLDTPLFYGDRAAFRAIRVWLVANDFQHHTTSIPSGLMVKYFSEYQAKGRSRLNKGGDVGG